MWGHEVLRPQHLVVQRNEIGSITLGWSEKVPTWVKFMDFLLEPENIAAVTNYARYAAGVKGVTPHLDPELATQPESVPPADAPAGTFVAVCDQATQEVYDTMWTRLKK